MTERRQNRHGWQVLDSVHSRDERYCIDYFVDVDGKFGFAEFRSDPEDQGRWTLTRRSSRAFPTMAEAVAESHLTLRWAKNAEPS